MTLDSLDFSIMPERDEIRVDDIPTNTDITELKSDADKKSLCIQLIGELFNDGEIMQVQLASIENWQTELPELAKGLTPFKNSVLDLIIVIGPNVVADEKDWLNGSKNNGADSEQDDEDEDGELGPPPSYCEVKFYFDNEIENPNEIAENDPDAKLALFLDDRYLEAWTMAEEKPNTFVERKNNKRKGNAQRLKMLAEILLYTKERLQGKP